MQFSFQFYSAKDSLRLKGDAGLWALRSNDPSLGLGRTRLVNIVCLQMETNEANKMQRRIKSDPNFPCSLQRSPGPPMHRLPTPPTLSVIFAQMDRR